MAVERLYPRTWSHNLTRGLPLVYTADGTGAYGDQQRAPGCTVGLKESFKNQAASSRTHVLIHNATLGICIWLWPK